MSEDKETPTDGTSNPDSTATPAEPAPEAAPAPEPVAPAVPEPAATPATPTAVTAPAGDFNSTLIAAGVSEAAIATLLDQEIDSTDKLGKYTFDQFVAFGIKAGSASTLVEKFCGGGTSAASAEPAMGYAFLPQVQDDTSFLDALRVGGVLKIGTNEVVSAIRAAIANRVGLFQLPDMIMKRMVAHATAQEEPLGPLYYELKKTVAKRTYGEILTAIGVPSDGVSVSAKNELLGKLDAQVWEAIQSFFEQLDVWYQAFANNPMMMQNLVTKALSPAGAMMPSIQPPSTNPLDIAAEAFNDKINRIFAGEGIPVSRALATDAIRIKELLETPGLPAAVGASSRDEMLKNLGANVGAEYPQMERGTTQFVLAIMEVDKKPAGNVKLNFLQEMWNLGNEMRPYWDALKANSVASKGGPARKGDGFREDYQRQ